MLKEESEQKEKSESVLSKEVRKLINDIKLLGENLNIEGEVLNRVLVIINKYKENSAYNKFDHIVLSHLPREFEAVLPSMFTELLNYYIQIQGDHNLLKFNGDREEYYLQDAMTLIMEEIIEKGTYLGIREETFSKVEEFKSRFNEGKLLFPVYLELINYYKEINKKYLAKRKQVDNLNQYESLEEVITSGYEK